MKKILAFLTALVMIICVVGCNSSNSQNSYSDTEVIVHQVVIDKEDDTMSNESIVSSEETPQNSSVDTPVSSEQEDVSSVETSSVESVTIEEETIDINYDWKSNPNDYKLLAFTFDDGPSSRMQDYVNLFAAFDGAGTFFVNGHNIKGDYEVNLMQNAVNYGWDIGNHGDRHLVATIGGGNGKEATYEALREDIMNLTHKLESNLVKRDGSPYEVSLYRAPNIKPTDNTFKICDELKYPIIWLTHDAYDWDETKTDKYREDIFKYGVGKWEDGDVILCHEVQQYADQTYTYIERYLPEFFRKGYRFCSITELMELRGISREEISGALNEVDGNRKMVTNIIKAAQQGKK